ncbi:uncharacterized protein LOC142220700 [Haematobia irritans]|uniref:uncharacterized protein LOC142220700 n=1 Tax=Haematobia irritans TaxID=7368 RepID=UPI003F4F7C60
MEIKLSYTEKQSKHIYCMRQNCAIEWIQDPACIHQHQAKLQAFSNRCLRSILKIWWPRNISNEELLKIADLDNINTQIKRRKYNWNMMKYVARPSNGILKDQGREADQRQPGDEQFSTTNTFTKRKPIK